MKIYFRSYIYDLVKSQVPSIEYTSMNYCTLPLQMGSMTGSLKACDTLDGKCIGSP